MTTILLVATPIYGHVAPMLALGHSLVGRGHHVTLMTGASYAASAAGAGMDFLPLPSGTGDVVAGVASRRSRSRVLAGRDDIISTFVRPLAAQHRCVVAALDSGSYDAVIADTACLGVLPLLSRPRAARPPVFGVSITPLSLTSPDCAPFGSGLSPGRSAFSRLRNRHIDFLLRRGPLRPLHDELERELSRLGAAPAAVGYFDVARLFDQTFHLSVPGLEYPRRDLPASLVFTGPLPPPTLGDAPPVAVPGGTAPLVHVTQGTFDNADLGKLVAPCLRALADLPVRVVATTGGRPVDQVVDLLGGTVPANCVITEFAPYAQLLPQTAVMVTNGGWGGVQQALAHGVPLVVAGRTEEKPEVAARVAWAGAGIDLKSGRPSPRRLRRAVCAVLERPRYVTAAATLQREFAAMPDPVDVVAGAVQAQLHVSTRRRG